MVSISSEYANNIIQYFKDCNGEIKDYTGLKRQKFKLDYNQNQRAAKKYLYSKT